MGRAERNEVERVRGIIESALRIENINGVNIAINGTSFKFHDGKLEVDPEVNGIPF